MARRLQLPAKDKMTVPRYQTLLNADIPSVGLPDGVGRIRVIAGEYEGHRGASEIPAAAFWVDTAQLYLLPHDRRSIATEGLEGAGEIVRTVTGGTATFDRAGDCSGRAPMLLAPIPSRSHEPAIGSLARRYRTSTAVIPRQQAKDLGAVDGHDARERARSASTPADRVLGAVDRDTGDDRLLRLLRSRCTVAGRLWGICARSAQCHCNSGGHEHNDRCLPKAGNVKN